MFFNSDKGETGNRENNLEPHGNWAVSPYFTHYYSKPELPMSSAVCSPCTLTRGTRLPSDTVD